jgi:hypothetical protein
MATIDRINIFDAVEVPVLVLRRDSIVDASHFSVINFLGVKTTAQRCGRRLGRHMALEDHGSSFARMADQKSLLAEVKPRGKFRAVASL